MGYEAARLPVTADDAQRSEHYQLVTQKIRALLEAELDWIAAMATVACELHHSFEYFHWTGFYRNIDDRTLVIGPYQGGHGCLRIAFGRGVCGTVARERKVMNIPDVAQFQDHIACSATTRSELVVPIVTPKGDLLGVLDVDSDEADAFRKSDEEALSRLCEELGQKFAYHLGG